MSQNIDTVKISCLLYLDRHLQADLADFLSSITRSRRGEVLREIIESGWVNYKSEHGVGMDADEYASMVLANETKRKKKISRKASPKKKQENEGRSKKHDIIEQVSDKDVAEENNNKKQEVDVSPKENSSLLGMKNVSIDDISFDEDEDDDILDPLAKLKMKSS